MMTDYPKFVAFTDGYKIAVGQLESYGHYGDFLYHEYAETDTVGKAIGLANILNKNEETV